MIECKLEDFQAKREALLGYASSLLKGRGFVEKDGELKAFSEDVVQQAYLRFHKCDLNAFVTEKHLDNCLFSFVYKEFLNTIDINRRGAQYILLKSNILENGYKDEFKQLNVRIVEKSTQDEFDVISSFKSVLDEKENLILDELLKGFSKVETSKNLNLPASTVGNIVDRIRNKYRKYESTTSKM